MYELLVAWQRSKDNPDEFRARVKMWVMPSAVNIKKSETRDDYSDFWKKFRDDRREALDKQKSSDVSVGDVEYFNSLKEITDKVSEMLYFFQDNMQVENFDAYLSWIKVLTQIENNKDDDSLIPNPQNESSTMPASSKKVTERADDQEPFQIWDQRAMVSLGPYSKYKHCYYSCPFCYVNTSEYRSFKQLAIKDIIDWLVLHKGEYDIVYISGDTDSFAGPNDDRQSMAVELVEAIELKLHVEIMITTRAIISPNNLSRLKVVRDKLQKKGLFFYACVSISSYLQKELLEPMPISSVADRVKQLKQFKELGMKTVLAMRPFLPIVPMEDYMSILELCKNSVDLVLGKEWYADEKGVLEKACKITDEYPFLRKQMYFDTNVEYWKVYSPQQIVKTIREWCDLANIKFFMTSRKAIDWVRASEPRTRFPRVIGIGALNINFIPKTKERLPQGLVETIGEEKEIETDNLWNHVEKSFGQYFTDKYEVFLGGGAYHAIECLSELDYRHDENYLRNLDLEFIGVAGKKIEKMFYKEMSACDFDIVKKLKDQGIETKYVMQSQSKPGITRNYWSGTSNEPQKAFRSNLTWPGANGELYDYLLNLMETDPFFVKYLAKADWIHVSSLFDHEAMSVIAELLTEAKKNNLGLKVSWDVGKLTKNLLECKTTLREIFRASDFVILSEKELKVFAGSPSDGEAPESNFSAASRLYNKRFPEANSALVVQLESLNQIEFYWRYKHQLVSQCVRWDREFESGSNLNVTAASAYLSAALIDSQLRPDLGFNMQLATNYGMELVWSKVTNDFVNRSQEFKRVRKIFTTKIEEMSAEDRSND
jgi:DNA repair photolyase/sugar/nucleoside kinase (ribokinase family)